MENKTTIQEVKKAVYSWSIRFRETVYDNQQLSFLSDDYYEDLLDLGVTSKQFAYAAKLVRQRAKFFPKMSDIMDAVNEYRSNPPVSDSTQIAETSSYKDPTPEEKEFTRKMGSLTAKVISKEMTADEAAAEMELLIEEKKKFSGRLQR